MPRFPLMVNHDGGDVEPAMDECDTSDVSAHIAAAGRAGIVRSEGASARAVSAGPSPECKEVLAGGRVVDIVSEARAIEIAARVLTFPGPGGVPIRQPMRPVR